MVRWATAAGKRISGKEVNRSLDPACNPLRNIWQELTRRQHTQMINKRHLKKHKKLSSSKPI